jgi:hypothetical protein
MLAVIIPLILILGVLWTLPYWTLLSIGSAIVENDPLTLSEKVDFPALRGNLKEQIAKSSPKPKAGENSYSAFGRTFGSKMGEWVVDSVVKPDAVIVFAQEALKRSANAEEIKSPWRRALAIVYQGKAGYEDFSTYSYRLPMVGEIRFELKRSGLGWRMTNAIIPPEQLKEIFQKATKGKGR